MHRLIPLKSFSTITDNTKYSNTKSYTQFQLLVTKQPKTLQGKDTEKFVENIFHGVSSIFPHTYIHFPSTSPLRYIARIESMSVTRNLHFPGKYTGGRGEEGIGRMVDAPRGGGGWVKKRGGWNVPPPRPLFSPLLSTVGKKGLEGEKFRRAQLFNRPYWPEWYPWVCGASTNS